MEDNNLNSNYRQKGVFPVSEIFEPQDLQYQDINLENLVPEPSNHKNNQTYMKLETKNTEGQISGVLEIDLISFREKGQESRYLSVSSIGGNSEGKSSNTILSIDNEADFLILKNFVSNLNWND